MLLFFFSSIRRHTRCALVTGVQTCALPIVVLPVDDISNAAAEAVANNIKGTLALPHPYGRLQFGEDLELHFRTLIGTGSNPNVAAVIVIGIAEGWTKRVVDGIAAPGTRAAGLEPQRVGADTMGSVTVELGGP